MQSKTRSVTIPQAIQAAVEHHQAGRFREAERIYQQILQVDPENADALHLLGVIAHQTGRNDSALQLIHRALHVQPSTPIYLNTLGEVYRALRRPAEALASYDKALAIKPDYAGALDNRGIALRELRRFGESLASHDKALKISPDFVNALSNRGNTLRDLNRHDEALASFDKALALMPDSTEVLVNRGAALRELNRHDEAMASFDHALAIKPGSAVAHWYKSMCRLLLGDFERGWDEYEWRWKCQDFPTARRDFARPLWLGREDIAGKTILLHAEQGLGDTIHFVRYTEAVARKGARVILEVQPALKSLLSDIHGADGVVSRGEPLPEFDFQLPMLSLPLAFGTRLETIPATVPYLRPAIAKVKVWKDRLGQNSGLNVGIAWSGSPNYRDNHNRSMALSKLIALANPNVRLISLMKEVPPGDEDALRANTQICHFGRELEDFSDTAALVSLMDLVISTDTSIPHLAGALGKPVWILLQFVPDWRWLLDREDSPWYPTARLFRQTRIGDWDTVVEKVRGELCKILGPGPQPS